MKKNASNCFCSDCRFCFAGTTERWIFRGIRFGLPVGDFGDTYSFGIGAELQGEARLASNVTIPFSAGYTHFIGKEI